MPRGRPSRYSKEFADEIVSDLSDGVPLAETCRRLGISRTAVYEWRKVVPEFDERFVRARETGFDALAEEVLAIADDGSNDWMLRNDKDGEPGYQLNGEHVQRSKLRAETRLRLLAKWDPARYGDKLGIEHSGSIDVNFKQMGLEDLWAEAQQLAATGHLPKLNPPAIDAEFELVSEAEDLV